MSVQKAEFRVIQSIVKAGRQRQPGYVFTAGINGEHVRRWLMAGRISIVRRVEKECPQPAAAPAASGKAQPDRVARLLALFILAAGLMVATRVSRVGIPHALSGTVELANAGGRP